MYDSLPMYQRVGSVAYKKDLTNTIKLCESIGNPQNKIKTIHIAGTNGKGTVTHIIAGGLQAQGFKVGVYTSPHYKDFRERIKINGEYISKSYKCKLARYVRKHLHSYGIETGVTVVFSPEEHLTEAMPIRGEHAAAVNRDT